MKNSKLFLLILLAIVIVGGLLFFVFDYWPKMTEAKILRGKKNKIEQFLKVRREQQQILTEDSDIFGSDDLAKILFIGIDSRVGVNNGHCDAIQFLEINRRDKTVKITAVPRGTYVPLPQGNYLPTDYYVSNSCGLVSLEYGVEQIEKILGAKADYLVVVGFSETMGILREMKFPTVSTMRWLRNRQSYAIGEPQRARNHSNFIKYVLTNYLAKSYDKLSWPWQYLIYRIVQTDLTFGQAQKLLQEVVGFDLQASQQNVILQMKPTFAVEDIIYNPDNVDDYLVRMIEPIKKNLSKEDYSDLDIQVIQENLQKLTDEKKKDPEFLRWALANNLWLQIEDAEKREIAHYNIISGYLNIERESENKKQILADYIMEMENRQLTDYIEKGKQLLEKEL
ncbi:MAG: hypothetical protein WCT18_01150 [Patescibacteria group bacterium]